MRIGCRSVALAAALVAVLAFGATADAQNKCSSGKAKLAGKKSAAIMGCYSKASGKGLIPDPNCITKAQGKFVAGSQKIDSKQDNTKPETVCPAGGGDEGTVETMVDNHDTDVANDLDPALPGGTTAASKCTAGKLKCSGKKDAALLGCYSKGLGKGLPVDPNCITKAQGKFSACYTKLESKEDVTKPDSVCVQPDGDAATIEPKDDNFATAIVAHYSPPPTCPTQITFTGTSTTGILDTGWTGQGHDATTITDGTVTVTVTGCAGAAPSCGVCTYNGPFENTGTNQLHVQRCEHDSSITCLTNTDCGANGPCVFFFGSYLPLAAGGVSTCVENVFAGGISGTANVNTGSSAGAASVTSVVFSGPTLSNPCPNCVGDATANDGVKGGTCSAGNHAGGMCDASGSSPNIAFGTTSLDCPPLDPGGIIAALPIDLSNTTGTKTRTLSAANPNCRAPGFTTNKCQCDTCNNAAATPCSTNADCGAGICGGKRCIAGSNNGAPCASTTECPGGACSVVGTATAPNQCDGGSGDCAPGDNTPPTSPNDHKCVTGPFEQFCGPVETFRGCTSNADCTRAGDTCSVSRFRECFDNGVAGDVVTASGLVDPPVSHQSNPRLAAMFCIGPTASGAVNGAAGLPGLGRLELTGHSVDNGTP